MQFSTMGGKKKTDKDAILNGTVSVSPLWLTVLYHDRVAAQCGKTSLLLLILKVIRPNRSCDTPPCVSEVNPPRSFTVLA